MTTAPPPAHYGAVKGALASGFATAELQNLWGHDPALFFPIEVNEVRVTARDVVGTCLSGEIQHARAILAR